MRRLTTLPVTTPLKQYHKEGRALRTETVINDTYDFDVGRRPNLDDLKQVGLAANRRLLSVERFSHDATIGTETLAALHRPAHIDGQRASTLRFGDPRVQALLAAPRPSVQVAAMPLDDPRRQCQTQSTERASAHRALEPRQRRLRGQPLS